MRKKEVKEIIKKKNIIKEISCDQCSNVICDSDTNKDSAITFFTAHTFHNDWGNDSVDSHNYDDICGLECLLEYTKDYFKESNGTEGLEVERVEETIGNLIGK